MIRNGQILRNGMEGYDSVCSYCMNAINVQVKMTSERVGQQASKSNHGHENVVSARM